MKWIQDNLALFTVLVAAFSAVFGGVVAAIAKFVFDFYLSERMRRRWEIIKIKRQYSAPIIRAIDDVAGRIENLQRFLPSGAATEWLRVLNDDERAKIPFERYYFVSTIFLFARLIGWIEVLKREQVFLDFTTVTETSKFNAYLDLIYAAISTGDLTSTQPDRQKQNHWIYWQYLSGIGEAVLTKENDMLRCISFPEFCRKYKDPDEQSFRDWMSEIERLFLDLSSVPDDSRWIRLQMLWFCLDCFLDFVDPRRQRVTKGRGNARAIAEPLKEKIAVRARSFNLTLS